MKTTKVFLCMAFAVIFLGIGFLPIGGQENPAPAPPAAKVLPNLQAVEVKGKVPSAPAPAKGFPANHPRGRKITPPAVVRQRRAYTKEKFVSSLAWMHKLIPASYDARTVSQTPTVSNQASCGDCYIHSGVEVGGRRPAGSRGCEVTF